MGRELVVRGRLVQLKAVRPGVTALKMTKIPFAVLLTSCLAACGTPPRLDIREADQFVLFAGRIAAGPGITVKDERPEEQKISTRFGGWVQIGDASLLPQPAEAVARAINEYVERRSPSSGVRAALAANEVRVKHFQVLAVNQTIESSYRGLEAQTLPGVLIMDGLIASLRRSTVGSSKVRVILAVDVADFRFSSDESITFTASPGADAPALVLEKALEPIFRRFEIAFGPR
jgi:hypothetical protein